MSKLFIGIDNGLDGAIVAVDTDGELCLFCDTPVIDVKKGKKKKREYLISDMVKILEGWKRGNDLVIILEKAQAMPKQGVSSSFSIGFGYGIWQGIINTFGIKHSIVHPKTWQKEMLRDIPGTDTKKRSVIASKRLCPELPLERKMDHNRADAYLMAEFCRRVFYHAGKASLNDQEKKNCGTE